MVKISKYLCVFAAFFVSSAAIASGTSWTISDADGQVTVTRDNKPIYGAQGTVLQAGDVVSTSKTARAVLVRGGKFVVVDPGKKIRIAKAKDKSAVSQIFEYLGELVSSDPKKNTFNSGTSAAVVKGLGDGLENGGNTAADRSRKGSEDDPAMWKAVEPQSL